jgi:hypothetical protein
MHPMDFFENAPAVKGGHCFVVMPFAGELDKVYSAIQAALQVEGLDVIAHRADEVVGGGPVMMDVVRNLAVAELVIVDLTGKNANVFYELGIAHTVRCAESVLLITQTMKDVPFDVQSYRCIEYALGADGLSQLQDKLVQFVKTEILPTRFLFRLAEGQSCASEKVLGEDRSLYSFAICDVMLARDSAQFRLDVFRHHLSSPAERVYSQQQPGLHPGERVPIPRIPYALTLDDASPENAVFCVCRPEPPAA